MSSLLKILNKPIVIITFGAVVTIGICLAVAVFLILPQFNEWNQTQEKNKTTKSKIDSLAQNIQTIKSFDPDEISRYTKIIDSFYPEKSDFLHFITLSEELAKFSGVGVTSLSISGAKTTGSAGTSPAVGPAAGANGAASTTTTATVASGTYVLVSYKGEYKKIETLLSKLENLDRAVGVSKSNLAQLESGSEVNASVTFYLPTAQQGLNTASSENVISLSKEDRSLLDEIEAKIEFFADPASNPLGKDNPFQ